MEEKRRLTLGERWQKDADLIKRGGTLFEFIPPPGLSQPEGAGASVPEKQRRSSISDKTAALEKNCKVEFADRPPTSSPRMRWSFIRLSCRRPLHF